MSIFEENNISLPNLDSVDGEENPLILAHFTHDSGAEWWICSGEYNENIDDILCFGVADIMVREMGIISIKQILSVGGVLDDSWTPIGLYDRFPNYKL